MYNILVCDDDKEIVNAIEIYLEKEGYQIYKAYNGKEALKTIDSTELHLVILDIMMPELDGISVAEKVRKDKAIPIIMLSAKSEDYDKIKGLNVGADDYIVKPFRIGELVARINNALRKYNKDTNIIKIDNVTIDTEKMSIYKNDHEVILTSLEWRILNTLLNSRGNTVTREKLLSLACDIRGNFINDNSLTVYVKRIREKLEDDINNPKIIKTIKGIGYRIENEDNR